MFRTQEHAAVARDYAARVVGGPRELVYNFKEGEEGPEVEKDGKFFRIEKVDWTLHNRKDLLQCMPLSFANASLTIPKNCREWNSELLVLVFKKRNGCVRVSKKLLLGGMEVGGRR